MKHIEGFTLLEVLLALAIFAGSALTLANSLGVALSGTTQVQKQQIALWVADNQFVSMQLEKGVQGDKGETQMAGDNWYWQVESKTGLDMTVQQLKVKVDEHRYLELWRYDLSNESQPNAQ